MAGGGAEVREVATPAARDEDLRRRARGMVDHDDAPAAPAALGGAEEPGRAGTDDEDVC
jgi:hypothetical protein